MLLLDYDASRPLKNLRIEVTQREWQPNGHKFTMAVETPAVKRGQDELPQSGPKGALGTTLPDPLMAPAWRTIQISPDKLKDSQGVALSAAALTGAEMNSSPAGKAAARSVWREVNILTLTGTAKNAQPPLFRNLRWAR